MQARGDQSAHRHSSLLECGAGPGQATRRPRGTRELSASRLEITGGQAHGNTAVVRGGVRLQQQRFTLSALISRSVSFPACCHRLPTLFLFFFFFLVLLFQRVAAASTGDRGDPTWPAHLSSKPGAETWIDRGVLREVCDRGDPTSFRGEVTSEPASPSPPLLSSAGGGDASV